MAARDHPLLGKWRIVETELWDSDFLDLVEPAYISFDAQGRGAFVFGAVQGSLHCRYGPDSVRFTWQGFDEMDPASGAGDAEPDEDGLLTGEIRFHDGDDSTFNRERPDLARHAVAIEPADLMRWPCLTHPSAPTGQAHSEFPPRAWTLLRKSPPGAGRRSREGQPKFK